MFMKKRLFMILVFVLPSLILSCNRGGLNSSDILTPPASTPVDTSPSSFTFPANVLTLEKYQEIQKGYSLEGILKAEYEGLKTVESIVEISSNSDYYQFHEFEGVEYLKGKEAKVPTKDVAGYTFNYSHKVFEATKEDIIYNSYRTINNEVREEIVLPSEDTPLLWETTGYKNGFALLDYESLEKQSDNSFLVNLDDYVDVQSSLSTQIFGGYGPKAYTLEITDGNKLSVLFDPILEQGSTVNVTYSFEGTFTKTGETASGPLRPLEGASTNTLSKAIDLLKKQNYHISSKVRSGSYGIAEYDGYVEYDKKYYVYSTKNSDSNYVDAYFEKDGKLHSAVKIKDSFYEDRVAFDYSLDEANLLPSFKISPLLFKETKVSDNISLYTLDKSIALKPTLSNVFSPFSTENIADLKIEVKTDSIGNIESIAFDNKKDATTDELATYDTLGQVKGAFDASKVKTDVSDLKWSEILTLSSSKETLEEVYAIIPQAILDSIPNIGGHTATIAANIGFSGTNVDLIFQKGQSLQEVETLATGYGKRLEKDGYTKNQQPDCPLVDYTKEINTNDQKKTLQVSVEPVDYSEMGGGFFLYVTVEIL